MGTANVTSNNNNARANCVSKKYGADIPGMQTKNK